LFVDRVASLCGAGVQWQKLAHCKIAVMFRIDVLTPEMEDFHAGVKHLMDADEVCLDPVLSQLLLLTLDTSLVILYSLFSIHSFFFSF
jgi:hypothetical protein